MDSLKLIVNLLLISLGLVFGDYFALVLRVEEIYVGLKYPIGSIIIMITIVTVQKIRKIHMKTHVIIGLLMIGFYIGTMFHHKNIENFPSDRNLLIIWISAFPYLFILNLKDRNSKIQNYLKNFIVVSFITIFSYWLIRSWEVGGETLLQFTVSTMKIFIPINIFLMLIMFQINNKVSIKSASLDFYKQDFGVFSIYIGILVGIWINSFRWKIYKIGEISQDIINFLFLMCFTGLVIDALKYLEMRHSK